MKKESPDPEAGHDPRHLARGPFSHTPRTPGRGAACINTRMSETNDTKSRLFRTDDAASYLEIGRRTLQELVTNREIGFIKIGRSIRFDRADLDQFIDARRVQAKGWKGGSK